MINNHDLWAMEYKALSSLLASMSVLGPDAAAGPPDRPEPGEYTIEDGVAVIPVKGVLSVDPSYYAKLFGYATAFADIRRMAIEAMNDQAVEKILLDIDSPGGTVAGTKGTATVLNTVGKAKPLYAWTSNAMTSAAYWLGSTARKIGAEATAQIGSIGVIATMMDISKMAERFGVKVNIIKTGKWKAAGHPFRPMSDDEKDYFQDHVDNVLGIFIRDVARFRGIDAEAAAIMSDDARVYLAGAAQENGLIDGTYDSREQFMEKASGRDKTKTLFPAKAQRREGITNKKETIMNIDQLKVEHPDVYDAAVKIGKELGKADAITDVSDKLARAEARARGTEERVMAIVGQVADEATVAKVQAILDTGIDAEKIEQLKAVFGSTETAEATANSTQQQILEALQNMTPAAVVDGGDSTETAETDEDKRKAQAKSIADRANR